MADITNDNDRDVLPTNVDPVSYFIDISPNFDPEVCDFQGRCTINLNVKEETSSLVCHSLDCTFTSMTVGDVEISPESLVFDKEKETMTINLEQPLPVGPTTMSCSYSSKINTQMKGFYTSKYKKGDQELIGGVTQFESTDARRAFPCWDEPNRKSKFTVQLTGPSDFTIISNMPEDARTDNGDGTSTVKFQESPTMSSYLVAWVIGEYEFVETHTERGVKVRVYTPLGKKEQGQYAVEFAAKVLDWYEAYFQCDYPLPKLDMVACADFAAGAMENWGLVTYREARVLVSETTGARSMKFICQVIAHELAHQWFGNLVTMDWWKELWLNEGFANWMESYCCDATTDYEFRSFFVTKSLVRALGLDCMLTSHPIEVNVRTSAEVDEIFDAISYCKGGSTVRMIQNFLGDEVFQAGLRTYMQKFQYGNTTTPDLWGELAEASGLEVAALMNNWTKFQGYPVISASLNSDGKLVVRQNRFLATGVAPPEEDEVIWSVPIVALTPQGEVRFLLQEREMVVNDVDASGWIHLNHGYCGFYRVNYSDDLLQRLQGALANQEISDPLDRFALVNDVLALSKSGFCSCTSVLQLLPGFKEETEQVVWESIVGVIGSIGKLLADEPEEDAFKGMVLELLSSVKGRLGWEERQEDTPEQCILRSDILGVLARMGDQEVIEEGTRRFWAIFRENQTPPASLRQRILYIGGKFGGVEEYNTLKAVYRETDDADYKRDLVCGMSMNKLSELHTELLEFTMTDEIRPGDKVFPLAYLGANRDGRDTVWQFVKDRWHDLYKCFDGGFLVGWVARVPQDYVTTERADEVEAFFATVRESSPAANRAMDQTVEQIRNSAVWRERDLANIKAFFQ